MKRLSLKEVKDLLHDEHYYCIRINELTRKVHLVRFYFDTPDVIIGYLTFNQFIKLDLILGLVSVPIFSYIYDYYRIGKEVK